MLKFKSIMALAVFFLASAAAHADSTDAVPAPSPSPSPTPFTTHNSKGKAIAVFTPAVGPAAFVKEWDKTWKDPSGMLWGSYQGDFANNALKPDQNGLVADSPATEACTKIGGILPTSQDYERLSSYFEHGTNKYFTDQGNQDINQVFPDMQDRWFWTSSVYPELSDDAYGFYATFGEVIYFDAGSREIKSSVRCVVP
jgi:hypothetical protein